MRKHNSFQILTQLIPFLWVKDVKIRARIVLAFLLTFAMIGINVCVPLFFKKIINILYNPNKFEFLQIQMILVFYGLLWAMAQIIAQLRALIIYRCLERGMRELSMKIFDHLHTLSLRFHFDRKSGEVTSTIERAQFGFDTIFCGLFLFLFPSVIEMGIVIILLTYFYGFFYSGALFFVIVFYLIFSFIMLTRLSDSQKVYNKKKSDASSFIVDRMLNFETVKYFGNEDYDREQCSKILQDQEVVGIKKYISDSLVQFVQAVVIGMGLIYLTLFSGSAVASGRMNIGDFVLINGYLLQFAIPLYSFGYVLKQVRRGLNDMAAVIDLMSEESEIKDAPDAVALKTNKAEIEFKNVWFGYGKQRQILQGVSFSVPAGKTVAIVGATGAGKSTISRLLFRFYDVTSGSILINGYDVRKITQQSLHALIGVVPQDTVLFNDSIYYNIAYGCPSSTKQEVEQAASLAHLDDFIKRLPNGYNTIVGERGLKLSGGEKQRVAIARVILKRPKIYVFDEATSSLDVHTEKEIHKNLEDISKTSTTVIIAHRLSTVVNVDEIIVLDEGRIIEQGCHQDLLRLNGRYASLWNKQIQKQFLSFIS